jgi:uncharacterized protein DUF6492
VTPAILSTAILKELQTRLEAVEGRSWMDILLTSYCDWTEYTLYLLAAERSALVERFHVWGDEAEAPARLHADPALSIWGGADAGREDVARLLRADDPGLFAVVQSSSGLTASDVAAAVAEHFPVRRCQSAVPATTTDRSKLHERARVATRLTAQTIYRCRRKLRRARVRLGATPMAHQARRLQRPSRADADSGSGSSLNG